MKNTLKINRKPHFQISSIQYRNLFQNKTHTNSIVGGHFMKFA
jgi:hypothetical protein